jgi:hypothetical protein
MTADISERQRVAFTEAALIRYFDPPLNNDFRETFPRAAHATYRECYDLDLNSVAFGLQTHSIFARVGSAGVGPAYVHTPDFPLHDPEDRRALFDFATPPDEIDPQA